MRRRAKYRTVYVLFIIERQLYINWASMRRKENVT